MSERPLPPDARGAEVLQQLERLPGGVQLLEQARARDDVELVGGAVRDILRGGRPLELDVVLGGEPATFATAAAELAGALMQQLGGEVTVHGRFGTATLLWDGGRIDIAARRAEAYAQPGALPEVRPGDPDEDLMRRDFTVNALAVCLGGSARGCLRAVEHGLADLFEERLRVLHSDSFIDDPTRLLRLCRYAARLDFAVEQETQLRAREALAGGALETISAARVGAELKLLLAERDPLAALVALEHGGVLERLAGGLRLDPELLAAASSLLPEDGRLDLLALASLLVVPAAAEADAQQRILALLDGWEYTAGERRIVLEAALRAPEIATEIAAVSRPSALWWLLRGVPVEAVALAGGLCAAHRGWPKARAAAAAWLRELRHTRLQITGEDLLAAGLAAGPGIGARLDRALSLKLDGKLADGREAELQAALEEQSG
ncbi:MAG TPA: hypothetical protein VGF95_04895 [Solirubrobacteraceae bacterium]|jgi:tRNA nucleotidyltransferase (CCA-adding enzyme)